jgi:hypothetical protein
MRTLFKFVAFSLVVFCMGCVSLAAMPSWIGDRVVDAVMDWGDKHIGGPFTKGGGDEDATRQVVSDILVPVKAWRAFLDITAGSESHTATAEQDTPGYSQSKGVPMPGGAHKQVPIAQPPSNQIPSSRSAIPVIPANHDHEREFDASATHSNRERPDTVDASSTSGTSKPIELRAGERSYADANKPMEVNLNPEHTTSGNPAPAAPAAQPARTPAPQRGGGGPDRGGPMRGAERIDGGGRAPGGTPPDRGAIDAHSGVS